LVGGAQVEAAGLEVLRSALEEQLAGTEAWAAEIRRLEAVLSELGAATHEQESRLAQVRQQIATEGNTVGHEWALANDLDTELARTRARLTEVNGRVATLAEDAAH